MTDPPLRRAPAASDAPLDSALSDELLLVAAEAARLGMWRWDLRANAVSWNAEMHAITGCAQPLTLPEWIERLAHPDERDDLAAANEELAVGPFPPSMTRIKRPDGEVRWVVTSGKILADERGAPAVVIGATMDVTEDHQARKRLREAQRMETLGHLAAGVAHNFNNMLMVIAPSLEALQGQVRSGLDDIVQDALDAADRASAVVRELMLIAGQQATPRAHGARLSVLLQDVARICRRALPDGVALKVDIQGDCELECEDGALEQVVTNLILNARDALVDAQTPAPAIGLSVEVMERYGEPWVSIVVGDNGPGIPEALQSRVFEPFFTTKLGKGTGLGLATCQAITARHGGQLACRSEPGRTEFLLLVPGSRLLSMAEPSTPPAEKAGTAPVAARVLIIDDEPAIRRLTTLGLQRQGMQASSAGSASEVAALLLAGDQSPDLILLDRSLGVESGRDLLPLLRSRLPQAKILYFTGQHIDSDEAAMVDGVVQKPIGGKRLAGVIAQALAS